MIILSLCTIYDGAKKRRCEGDDYDRNVKHDIGFNEIFPGGDNPQEHSKSSNRGPFPCSDCLWLWTPYELCGEEVDPGL